MERTKKTKNKGEGNKEKEHGNEKEDERVTIIDSSNGEEKERPVEREKLSKEEMEPIVRRPALMRTPPTRRDLSTPDPKDSPWGETPVENEERKAGGEDKEDEVFTSDYTKVGSKEDATGVTKQSEVVELSRRRQLVARIPPLPLRRTSSMPDSIQIGIQRGKNTQNRENEGKEKRKRAKDSLLGGEDRNIGIKKSREIVEGPKRREEKKWEEISNVEDLPNAKLVKRVQDLIDQVDKGVANLYGITSGSRSTKVDIKDQAEVLVGLMKMLTAKDIRKLAGSYEAKKLTREIGIQTDQQFC